jgi:hypothetical protein
VYDVSTSHTDKLVLEETEFAGDISIKGETAPIRFRVSADSDCRLCLDADAVDSHAYFLAVRSHGAPGTCIERLALTGTSADGKTISSEDVFVREQGDKDDRRWIDFRSRASKVTIPLERRIEKPVMRLWFRSFMSFRNPVVETSLGRFMVSGKAENVAPDDVSGCVTLEAPSVDPGNDWRDKAVDFLRHMQKGLALAHGGRLQTPRLDFIHDLTSEITFFDGAGFAPEFPVQYHLNQGPFIAALARRYEWDSPIPEILWTALGWMQTDTTFDELRLLTAMIGLEAIIDIELPEQNKKSAQKIHALFDYYRIPKRDFEGNVIRGLVNLRNDIVHKGFAPNDADLWPSIILVRELITRILLKEIGFVGRYCCYIGGLNDRDFPGEIESPQKT